MPIVRCAYDGLDTRALALWSSRLALGLAGFSHDDLLRSFPMLASPVSSGVYAGQQATITRTYWS